MSKGKKDLVWWAKEALGHLTKASKALEVVEGKTADPRVQRLAADIRWKIDEFVFGEDEALLAPRDRLLTTWTIEEMLGLSRSEPTVLDYGWDPSGVAQNQAEMVADDKEMLRHEKIRKERWS